jgi:hypothetical protein
MAVGPELVCVEVADQLPTQQSYQGNGIDTCWLLGWVQYTWAGQAVGCVSVSLQCKSACSLEDGGGPHW